MTTNPSLYMVGVIATDAVASQEFYERLGLEFGAAGGSHREAKVPGLTFFVDGRPSVWHPSFEERPYPWLIEFYFDSIADLEAKVEELAGAGYEVVDRPYDNGYGMWFAFVADPDGNTVLLSAERSDSS